MLSDKLVPDTGILWGAAAGGFTDVPAELAVGEWERKTGRPAAIFHIYKRGDHFIPSPGELSFLRSGSKLLLMNWKVAYNSTWGNVVAGKHDDRIDAFIKWARDSYKERFFLALHHEPENDVKPEAGSGMTAADYAKMFRYVIERIRKSGVKNVVSVWAMMTYHKHMEEPWWKDLWPGKDVVDWIGFDTYANAKPGAFHYGDFASVLDRAGKDSPTRNGFYRWCLDNFPGKPIMLAEWGVYRAPDDSKSTKVPFIKTVRAELNNRPRIKAMVYFDAPKDQHGNHMTILDEPAALKEFKKLATDPIFNVTMSEPKPAPEPQGITVEECRARVEAIRAAAEDDEAAHGMEDDLHFDVLKAIAAGASNGKALATEAIKTAQIEFARWTA